MLATVTKLIELGADVNAVDEDGMSSLFYAARNDSRNTVKVLLANGASHSLRNKVFIITRTKYRVDDLFVFVYISWERLRYSILCLIIQ